MMALAWMSLAWFAFIAAILCAAAAGRMHHDGDRGWSAAFGVVSAVFGALVSFGVWKAMS